jgi:Bacterial Ig-like domain
MPRGRQLIVSGPASDRPIAGGEFHDRHDLRARARCLQRRRRRSPAYTGTIAGDCAGTGAITLSAGEDATCTVTNDDKQPQVDNEAPHLNVLLPVHETTIADSTPTYRGDAGTAPGDANIVTVDIYAGVNLVLQGLPVQTLTAPVSGSTWTVDGGPPLADGTYTVRAWQLDSLGHFGSSNIPFFTIDATAPAVAITAPGNGSSGTDTTPTISGTAGNAAGDAASVMVRLFGGSSASGAPLQILSAPRSGAAWTIDAATLAPGTYTVVASQADGVGNTGTSPPVTFTVSAAGGGIGPVIVPPVQVITDFLCAFRGTRKCSGLPIQTRFTTSPGNAVWIVGAFSISSKGAAAATRTLTLGKLTKRITKNGTVKVVFKVKGAKARKLLKQVRRLKLNRLRIKLTYSPDGKPAVVQTSIIKLSKPR